MHAQKLSSRALHDTLKIEVVYPVVGMTKPNVSSNFIYGSVGRGGVRLSINGRPVPVDANGAFLAYLKMPRDGVYRLSAQAGGITKTHEFRYRKNPPPDKNDPFRARFKSFDRPFTGWVVTGSDTSDNGSDAAGGSQGYMMDRRWSFLKGTRLHVVGRRGPQYRVRLADTTSAWVDTAAVQLTTTSLSRRSSTDGVSIKGMGREVDVRIPARNAPFYIDSADRSVMVTFYGIQSASLPGVVPVNPLIETLQWQDLSGDSSLLTIRLKEPLWGFKTWFDSTGAVHLRLRRPPRILPDQPLFGLQIVVDAGHPPGGSTGPTGLTESEANLKIALRLAERLRRHGAVVWMTRLTEQSMTSGEDQGLELKTRAEYAASRQADLLVSVHNNACKDGMNPFLNFGTETYYFHSFSAPLAEILQEKLLAVTGLPDLKTKRRSLALVRPSWMPSTLTESVFMMFPKQEALLRNETFIEDLVSAHLDGIETFVSRYAVPSDVISMDPENKDSIHTNIPVAFPPTLSVIY